MARELVLLSLKYTPTDTPILAIAQWVEESSREKITPKATTISDALATQQLIWWLLSVQKQLITNSQTMHCFLLVPLEGPNLMSTWHSWFVLKLRSKQIKPESSVQLFQERKCEEKIEECLAKTITETSLLNKMSKSNPKGHHRHTFDLIGWCRSHDRLLVEKSWDGGRNIVYENLIKIHAPM